MKAFDLEKALAGEPVVLFYFKKIQLIISIC